MKKKEQELVLKECDEKLAEIDLKKEQADKAWECTYNSKYRIPFAVVDLADKVVTTKIGGGILVVSGAAIYVLSHSWALTVGVPSGCGLVAILGNVSLMAANFKRRMEYWEDLGFHEKLKNKLEEERYPYQLVSDYLRNGKKFLLHQYRQNLDVATVNLGTDEESDELDYLDIDTTNLSPLMVRTISEMKDETLSLAEAEKSALLVDINAMHTRIVESDFPVSFLQEYQKVLTKYAPPVESTTLTSK